MKNLVSLILTISTLLLITTITVLYSNGWRLSLNLLKNKGKGNQNSQLVVIKTGMLAVRSIPEAAKIYINDKPITATDTTISSLKPDKYKLTIIKEGFEIWEKEVRVHPELVTDITAVLVRQSPKLEPLTNTDVNAFSLSSNQNKIAFLTKNHKTPGIWILPLTGSPLNLFRNDARLLISDSIYASPSLGEEIFWAPDDKEILVRLNENGYLLYENNQNSINSIPNIIRDHQMIVKKWEENWKNKFLQERVKIVEQQTAPEWIINTLKQGIICKIECEISSGAIVWSPDDEKFFFFKPKEENANEYDLIIYNSEDPLPIDEKRIYSPLTNIKDIQNIKIYWYSDSYHLIIVERTPKTENHYVISLIRIDGSNKTTIYTGTLSDDKAYPTPSGDKIIVLTSLKENSPNNLYAITIR